MLEFVFDLILIAYSVGAFFGIVTLLSEPADSVFAHYDSFYAQRRFAPPEYMRLTTTFFGAVVAFIIVFCYFNPALLAGWAAHRSYGTLRRYRA